MVKFRVSVPVPPDGVTKNSVGSTEVNRIKPLPDMLAKPHAAESCLPEMRVRKSNVRRRIKPLGSAMEKP